MTPAREPGCIRRTPSPDIPEAGPFVGWRIVVFECSWIRGVVLAGVCVTLVGSGIGLLATSMAAVPTTAPRPAVLLLPVDGAGAVHTGFSTVTVSVTVKKPMSVEWLEEDLKRGPGPGP